MLQSLNTRNWANKEVMLDEQSGGQQRKPNDLASI